jgi:selenocysteine lyase/cysteine desulfurase
MFWYIFMFNLILNSNLMNSQPKFGKHLLDLFFIDKNYINVNHGSYGSPPRQVMSKHHQYQEECDSNPEKWLRYKVFEKYNETRKIVADYINADQDDIVFVENASDGVNSIFKSIEFSPGDKILILDCIYSSVASTLKYLEDTKKIQVVKFVLDKEIINSDEIILQKLMEFIQQEGPIKFASIDHIPSVPHVILPVKMIIELLKRYNIITFIDGAHVVGQIPLDIRDLNPDFYISNFHKWGYAAKTVSLLYVKKEFQSRVHPNIITSKYRTGFVNEYSYTGTKDYSSIFTIPDAIEFRKSLGETEIMKYMNDLAWEAGIEVAKIWGTETLIINKVRIGSMVNVRLPINDEEVIRKIIYKALFEHNVYMITFKFNDNNHYVRFSGQIYNEISDYIYAAETFNKLLEELKGEKALEK